MSILFHVLITLTTFLFMEAWAWFMHKYFLHGPLWFLHKSHHEYTPGWFEWNDLVSMVYGVLAAVLIIIGIEQNSWLLGLGVGISLYGAFYFVFHDIIIHRRIKIKYRAKNMYIKRLIRAHKIHHRSPQRTDGEAFGFLYADKKFEGK